MHDPHLIADQIERAFAGEPWHGPGTASLLAGVTAGHASQRVVESGHTIWEIVAHMTNWHDEVRERLDGKAPSLPRDGDWPEPAATSAEAWAEARRRLESSVRQLAEAVRQLDPDELRATVGHEHSQPLGTGVTCLEMLLGVLQHDAYHSGQIAILARGLHVDG